MAIDPLDDATEPLDAPAADGRDDTRDAPWVVVIVASAGGLGPLRRLVAALPASLRAAVVALVHSRPGHRSLLPEILRRAGPLPVALAADGAALRAGLIYVAPPNAHHVIVERGVVRLVEGAKVHHFRPAFDPLLASAARAYGPRVIAVVLSGMNRDGREGLRAVKAAGGQIVVQEPSEAEFAALPEAAMVATAVDHRAPAASMGALLARLTGSTPDDAL